MNENVVVLAGGDEQAAKLLFLNQYESSGRGWTLGPKLPLQIYAAKMIAYKVNSRCEG